MDQIKQLPEHIANQIAAGEVVQRPASIVKELLENAIDAKATDIHLLLKDAGMLLIQTTDNGIGMSSTDARMCWERHATSKIRTADDLFKIRSFGFRGEALASIAAVAFVEMKTKRKDDAYGTLVRIEGNKIIEQSPVSHSNGTQFSVKNLFYNIPARRNFLKSIPVELKHIIDEVVRVAMPNPHIAFKVLHNDKTVFDLKPTDAAYRLAELLGKSSAKDFLAVEELHDLVNIKGFVGPPDMAKRTRGEQFLFVNNRFVKDHYLNHAIVSAFDQMIAKEQYPTYSLYLDMDPGKIDVNIHPTKTEIKFDDEKSIYALIKSAVRKALGQFTASPELDFGDVQQFSKPVVPGQNHSFLSQPKVKVDSGYNPFNTDKTFNSVQKKQWQQVLDNEYIDQIKLSSHEPVQERIAFVAPEVKFDDAFQMANAWIVVKKDQSLLLVDPKAAHERILFDQYLQHIQNKQAPIQQLLFPKTVELSPQDYVLAHELIDDLKHLGFDVADFGQQCLIINGIPADAQKGNEKDLLEAVLEYVKQNSGDLKTNKVKTLALGLAQKASTLRKQMLQKEEIIELLQKLFKCEQPNVRPNGKPVFVEINQQQIFDLFK